MKKELMQALGKRYSLEGNIIVDNEVQGFDHHRNVAQVSFSGGKVGVKRYLNEKRWFGNEIRYSEVADAVKYIKS